MIRLGNNEVLKTLTFVDADADANTNADVRGSTIALRERCSGKLKNQIFSHFPIVKTAANYAEISRIGKLSEVFNKFH